MKFQGQQLPADILGVKTKGRKLNEEQIMKIIEKREAGQSVHSIAVEMKINRGTVLWYTCPSYRERLRKDRQGKYKSRKDNMTAEEKKELSIKNKERYAKKANAWKNMTAEQKIKAVEEQTKRYIKRLQGVEAFKIKLEGYKNGKH